MHDLQFDRITRRLVLNGLTTGSIAALLGLDEAASKKKPSKRKRCRRKKRVFCASRCCPKGQRCEHKTCYQPCEDPFTCSGGGGGGDACAFSLNCYCTTTTSGAAACAHRPLGTLCTEFQFCGSNDSCPPGQFCGTCSCPMTNPSFRCFEFCPSS